MSAGSYSRAAKQHLFLLVSPLATVTNGQLEGDGRVFVHETGAAYVSVSACVSVRVHACRLAKV